MNNKITQIIEIVEDRLKGFTFQKYEQEPMYWKQILQNQKSAEKTIEIKEQKIFEFDENYNQRIWYKNIVLPRIQVKILPQISNKEFKMQGEFFIARLGEQKLEISQLFNTETLQFSLENQTHFFAGMKFPEQLQTNKDNSHPFIIIAVFENLETNEIESIYMSEHILFLARKKSWLRKKNFSTLFEPFIPDNLDKGFEKVNKNKFIKEPIGDDLESLSSFFCNPYIRHKILHPLFLKLRFHKALRFFYNKQSIQESEEHILISIQRQINKMLISIGNESDLTPEFSRPIILCLDQSQKEIAEKIKLNLKILVSPIISVFVGTPQIPSNYEELLFSQKLKQAYKSQYNDLQRLKFDQQEPQNFEMKRQSDDQIRSQSFFPQKQNRQFIQINANQPPLQYQEEEISKKKIKLDEKESNTTKSESNLADENKKAANKDQNQTNLIISQQINQISSTQKIIQQEQKEKELNPEQKQGQQANTIQSENKITSQNNINQNFVQNQSLVNQSYQQVVNMNQKGYANFCQNEQQWNQAQQKIQLPQQQQQIQTQQQHLMNNPALYQQNLMMHQQQLQQQQQTSMQMYPSSQQQQMMYMQNYYQLQSQQFMNNPQFLNQQMAPQDLPFNSQLYSKIPLQIPQQSQFLQQIQNPINSNSPYNYTPSIPMYQQNPQNPQNPQYQFQNPFYVQNKF